VLTEFGIKTGRGLVERLMRQLGITGAVRGKTVCTTIQDPRRCVGRGPGEPPVRGRCAEPVVGGRLHLRVVCGEPAAEHEHVGLRGAALLADQAGDLVDRGCRRPCERA
jgi:hypothetical protein